MEYALIWIATGALTCFLLGLPREDIGSPLKALAFLSLWPVWLGIWIWSYIKKNGHKDGA